MISGMRKRQDASDKEKSPDRIRRSHTVSRSSADGVHSDRSSGTACGVRCDSGQLCAGILYLFINVAYSMGLKDVPLLDVTILASGFCCACFSVRS